MNGLAEIDPRRLQNRSSLPPKPIIEEILVDKRPHGPETELVVPPGHHRIEFAYTAPLVRGGEWVRFRHRLDGIDHDWISVGSHRLAAYDGLPPGDYAFRIAAADDDGHWYESEARFAFTVQPYFWQTLWFRVGVVLLLAGTSSATAWWYLHRKHQHQLATLALERQQHAELAHASRVALLGELATSLAHELKQPLAAILSNAQAGLRFLNHDPANLSEVRDILTDIAESDRRASEIISRMRAMIKKGETQMEARDLNADVEQVLQLLHSELTTRRVSVETRLAPDLPPSVGDHIQLQQVLLNLVVNGCDAMQANAAEDRQLVIETAVIDEKGQVRISVADCGEGIPPDKLERIFEPFYSTKDSGLGMGLAICRAIIKSHGGHLWSVNNPNRGATFHFTLMIRGQTQAR